MRHVALETDFAYEYEEINEKLKFFYESSPILKDMGFENKHDYLALPFEIDFYAVLNEHPNYNTSLIPFNNAINKIIKALPEFDKLFKELCH